MAREKPSFRDDVRNASIFQWNARGLKSRISDFQQYVFMNQFLIIIICEPLSAHIRLSGYECFMSATHGECSKVILFIRRDLTYVHHAVPPNHENQYVCLTVKKGKLTFTVFGAYISPSSRLDC